MFGLVRRNTLPTQYYTRTWRPLADALERASGWGDHQVAEYFSPAIDAKETNEAFVFELDLPGVRDEDLDVQVENQTLTIKGKRERKEKEENESYCSCERSYGSFSRSFTLPVSADTESVTADLSHGVLTVSVSKKPEVQPKQITVSASS